jgi:large subunit ribosomal protein LP2
MKYIAAYALCVLGGKAEPSKDDISKVLKEAGVKAEDEQLDRIVNSLKGKTFHELVASGKKKMSSMGSVAAPAGGASAAGGAKPAEAEKPKEEEAADVDMGGLFGDDY